MPSPKTTTTTTTTTFLLLSFHHHHHHHHRHHISIVFPPPPPPPPHFYCFPSTTTTTTTATTFLLFSLLLLLLIFIVFPPPPPPPHFYCFPSSSSSSTSSFLLFFLPPDSIKDHQLPFLVHFVAMSRVVNNNRGFLQLLADCPAYQRQFLLKTATPQQLHALVQVLYNIIMGHIPIPEENKRILLPYKDALLNLASPNFPYKSKKRVQASTRG